LLEEYTGIPVVGVIPHIRDIRIEEEDSVGLASDRYRVKPEEDTVTQVKMAIVQFPHLSNFTDFDPLFIHSGISAQFCTQPTELRDEHVLILPGTKNTVDDLHWLEISGWSRAIHERHQAGTVIFGVCGGFQMLGHHVVDDTHLESLVGTCAGLALLPITTQMSSEKRTVLVQGVLHTEELNGAYGEAEPPLIPVNGYEIHLGVTTALPGYLAFSRIRAINEETDHFDGARDEGNQVMGTYLHGIFANEVFLRTWLAQIRDRFQLPLDHASNIEMPSTAESQEAAFNSLASVVRSHLQMDIFYEALGRS
jgi:adenosylcobyric acid synthase